MWCYTELFSNVVLLLIVVASLFAFCTFEYICTSKLTDAEKERETQQLDLMKKIDWYISCMIYRRLSLCNRIFREHCACAVRLSASNHRCTCCLRETESNRKKWFRRSELNGICSSRCDFILFAVSTQNNRRHVLWNSLKCGNEMVEQCVANAEYIKCSRVHGFKWVLPSGPIVLFIYWYIITLCGASVASTFERNGGSSIHWSVLNVIKGFNCVVAVSIRRLY